MVSHNIKSTAMMNKDDLLLLLFLCVILPVGEVQTNDLNSLNRSSFPAGFIFGMSSSAYQYEGAAHEGGKGQSIWDTFTEKYPDKIDDRSSGLVADDTYHRYKEDIPLLKDMGLDAYRISLSWPRLLPRGKLSGGVNQEGIAYYNNLINEILSNGLQPFVAIFHWDVPQSLEDEYGGFLSHQIVNDFRHYAELCFRTFGDRVKHWITVNEPVYFTSSGYANGKHAPGRCSKWSSGNCTCGDSGTEPYLVLHNLLLAHADAVKLYRQKYQMTQKGQIGFTINIRWVEPQNRRKEDYIAVTRYFAFSYGWFLEPLKSGCYPVEMVNIVKDRLPKFTKIQSLMVKGSFDFIGVNYYTALYASDGRPCQTQNLSYLTDSCVNTSYGRNGNLIGEEAASEWLHIYPRGIKNTLIYLKQKFKNPIIYVTENGIDEVNSHNISLEDNARVKYHTSHLFYINRVITENDVDVRGYFAWTFLDDFEWSEGYTVRFGFYYVDYKNGLKRHPKRSAKWFKRFLEVKRK